MNHCHYYQKGICKLLTTVFSQSHHVNRFCHTGCKPNSPEDQKRMLLGFGVYVENVDDLEHAEILYSKEAEARKLKAEQDRQAITQAVNELPSKYQMVKNLGRHALKVVAHYKKTGRVKITDEHQQARTTECLSCENHRIDDRENLRCALRSCGCHLTGDLGRLGFEALPCDIGKHDEIDKQFIGP